MYAYREYAALVKDCRPLKEEEEEDEDSWLYGLAGYSGYTGGNGHGGVNKEEGKQEETKERLWHGGRHAERVGAALTLLTHLLAFDEVGASLALHSLPLTPHRD